MDGEFWTVLLWVLGALWALGSIGGLVGNSNGRRQGSRDDGGQAPDPILPWPGRDPTQTEHEDWWDSWWKSG
jgi:hypothetical protein